VTTDRTQDHAPLHHPSDSNHHSPSEAIPPRRKRGAPFGNQNAHRPCGELAESNGFYSSALTPEEQQALLEAAALKDLLSEIARACGELAEPRVKLMELVAYPDTSTELLLQAARAITRMVDVQHKVTFH